MHTLVPCSKLRGQNQKLGLLFRQWVLKFLKSDIAIEDKIRGACYCSGSELAALLVTGGGER